MIRIIEMLLWCLFVIIMCPAINAKVFLIQLKPSSRDNIRTYFQTNRFKLKQASKTPERILLNNLLGLFTPNYSEKSKNKCIRLFGSIYGTKTQRQECLEKIKKRQTKIKVEDVNNVRPRYNNVQYEDLDYFESSIDPFIDLTRYEDKQSAEYPIEYELKPELPNYIVDPNELRSNYIVSNTIGKPYQKPKDVSKYLTSRRSYPFEVLSKRNMNFKTSEESDSSDIDSDEKTKSEEKSKSEEKQKPVQKPRKPKRFQVVDNEKWKRLKVASRPKPISVEETPKPISVEETSGSIAESDISQEVKPKKKQAARKPKPEKNKKKTGSNTKEYYLQASRIVDAESDDDFRRSRMPYFLPKRFYWDEDEIQNLGYYWFNGPQGRYPHYALRP